MVRLLDSTLREGEQTPGVYFPPDVKLAIAQHLDNLGVDLIEAGNPAVDPAIAAAVTHIAQAGLKAKIGAHSLCRIDHVQQALSCGVDFLGTFFCVSPLRLERDYHISLEAAIEKVVTVITYAKAQRQDILVRYTPEDTVRSPLENVTAVAIAAVQAGADIISIADTTGYATPFQPHRSISRYVRALKQALVERNLSAQIAVHCHNDRGLALANALDAYQAGADIIDVSVMGLGERAGIVDLAELLINLLDVERNYSWNLSVLPALYALVSQQSHIPLSPHHPVVGKNAFTHSAGVHVKAVAQDETLYQSINPKLLGKESQVSLGMQSGCTSVELILSQIGKIDLANDRTFVTKVLSEVKEMIKSGTPKEIESELKKIVELYAQGHYAQASFKYMAINKNSGVRPPAGGAPHQSVVYLWLPT
ncbi:MAG: hypothetical protein VKK04_15995 [Synechococcales bacterium]|nr:hypothetical protein [Synechococcales bacterium]